MRASENPPLVRAFAAEMKGRRTALGLSQEALALNCGVNRTFVTKLELAQSQPTLSVMAKIAEGLDVSLPTLLEATMVRYRVELKMQRKSR